MTNEQYDDLLAAAREARRDVDLAVELLRITSRRLGSVLEKIDREESRIAHDALTSMHSASRKLVVGE